MNELALFAGAGGGILGGKLLGWRTVCAVEREAYPAAVLAQRQNDGLLEPFPIWSDVTTFDGKPWRGIVDVISGGFPCQDISTAGKGAGITGERSGLWGEMVRIIREVRPRLVFVENSPALTSRGLGTVLGDLAALGYDAEWGVVGAHHVGAPHKRDRIWVMAYSSGERHGFKKKEILSGRNTSKFGGEDMANTESRRRGETWKFRHRKQTQRVTCGGKELGDTSIVERDEKQTPDSGGKQELQIKVGGSSSPTRGTWWSTEPRLGRVANGVGFYVDRLKAIGNGQVPAVAATAWRLLAARAGIQF